MMFNWEITTRLSLLFPEEVVPNQADQGEREEEAHNFKMMILYGLEFILQREGGVQE